MYPVIFVGDHPEEMSMQAENFVTNLPKKTYNFTQDFNETENLYRKTICQKKTTKWNVHD